MRPEPDERGRSMPDPADLDEDEAEYGDKAGVRRGARRKDASMTLLTSMLERPLDPGYEAAARRRVARGEPAATSPRRPFLLVSVLLIGLVMGITAADLRGREGVRVNTRQDLVQQIHDRQAEIEDKSERARELQRDIDAATAELDPGLVDARREDREALRVATGMSAVRGPGLRVTMNDAAGVEGGSADGDPRTGLSDENRVQSKDLQIVTNGLWRAGAEAIAINGQRLTSRSAIRFAGEAILVNFRPLTRPYTIEAIGSPEKLRVGITEGSAGSYVQTLRSDYDIRISSSAVDELTLPSAVDVGIRRAEVIPPDSTPPPPVPAKKESR